MLDQILREAFRLAHLRLRLIFLDLLWKVIWFVLTLAALLLVAAWFGSAFRSIGWMDTGNRAVNAALLLAHVGLTRRDRVGLCTFSGSVHAWVPPRPQANQMRVLQVEATLVPGSFAGELHGATPGDAATPVRSVQIAYTMFFVAVR